jgi:protein transport protein SEC31
VLKVVLIFLRSSETEFLNRVLSSVSCCSNPYSVDARPGTAKVAGAPSKPPVSGTFDPTVVAQLSPDQQATADDYSSLISALHACSLSFSEKKQLAEAEKAVTVFTKKMARGGIDESVIGQVTSMGDALKNRNYPIAQSIITGLVNHEWGNHKDFLRGLKLLIQLSMKRLQ